MTSETERVWTIRHDDVSWTATDGGDIVILNMADSRYLSLNTSARVLWERLVDGASRASLIRSLVERYGLSDEAAAADVDTFVAGLEERGLVEVEAR